MTRPKVGLDHYSRSRFKRALLHFLLGKAFSGVANFAVLILIVRLLEPSEYGAYVSLLAVLSIALSYSSFGIEPSLERFLPELRVARSQGEVGGLVIAGLLLRLLSLILAGAMFGLTARWISAKLGLDAWIDAVVMFGWVILATGALNTVLSMMDALLRQHLSQITSAAHALMRLLPVSALYASDVGGLNNVVLIEGLAAVVAVILGTFMISRDVMKGSQRPSVAQLRARLSGYATRLIRFASFNYLGQCLKQLYSNEAMRLAVTRMLGVTETARFGLVSTFMDLVNRYLPAVLLIRLIRPMFVTRYVENKDFGQINAFAALVLKLNMFAVVPIVAICVHSGDFAISYLSGGKYVEEGLMLACAMALLGPTSHQWVVSIIADTVERNELQPKGALVSIIGLPVMIVLAPTLGVWAAFVGAFVSAIAYNVFAVHYLRRRGFAYRQDLVGLAKLAGAGLLGLLLISVAMSPATSLGQFMIVCTGLLLFYLILCFLIKPFSDGERTLLNSVLPRKVFVF